MIHGIGTDIVRIQRIVDALARHGERFATRVLAPAERPEFAVSPEPARFLAKRFAAKEAFGKALGTGVARPATLHAVAVAHDPHGRPLFHCSDELSAYLGARAMVAHLSLSDETDYVVAFALIEIR
ncbi:MAG TPA: holo-ACP synthase [Rhodocyclaceae bacterium]|nr:holo-ACP synthase [Rhodocyclaceae bacterium]